MSMFRKTVLTTAIIGAGLASTAGAAFAGDCPEHGHSEAGHGHEKVTHENGSGASCLNAVDADAPTGVGSALGDVFGAPQAVSASNVCGNFSNNEILTGNNISLLGNIQNGDTTTNTETTRSASTEGNRSPATIGATS